MIIVNSPSNNRPIAKAQNWSDFHKQYMSDDFRLSAHNNDYALRYPDSYRTRTVFAETKENIDSQRRFQDRRRKQRQASNKRRFALFSIFQK